MSARRKSLFTLLVIPLVVLLSVVAVGVANASRSPDHKSITVPTITISSFVYHTPASVAHGALINVVNQDSVKHTVTSNTAGKFNVVVPAHSTRSFHAPTTKGTYNFHCTLHSTMHGVLHVS